MPYFCFSCNTEFSWSPGQIVGRRECCPSCDADMHCCRNCTHYDESSYNECREPQSERVVVKDRSNFCDYFELANRTHDGSPTAGKDQKEAAIKKLDDLFK